MSSGLADFLSICLPPTCQACRRPCQNGVLCHRCALVPPLCPGAPLRQPIAPRYCDCCFGTLVAETGRAPALCDSCLERPEPFRRIRYLWEYDASVRSAIHAMKYNPSAKLARWFGGRIGEALSNTELLTKDWTHLIPIPGTPAKVLRRGFDQGLLIAEEAIRVAKLPGKILRTDCLKHREDSSGQADTPHQQRFANSKRSLLLGKRPWPGARILLIDDVATTGASAAWAAALLRRAGASAIDLLTLARASAWDSFRFDRTSWSQQAPRNACYSQRTGVARSERSAP